MRAGTAGLLAAAACLPFATACERSASGLVGQPRPPNLVLVSFDSLRPDHLGAYGSARDTSPNLDRFAARSVVFEHAYSTSTWTLPGARLDALLAYPEEHGARYANRGSGPARVLLPETLQSAGYCSSAVVSVGLAAPRSASPRAEGSTTT
jgi:arylsulfatase A-like enzyme